MSILKIIGILILILIVIFIAAQIYFSMMSSDIESYEYEVIKEYDNFEIRLYEEALFSYVTMPYSSYQESSGKGFRILAGYIFGGNERSEKIAMTSPVEINMSDSITMKFMVPNNYKMEDLPKPDNSTIQFKKEPKKYLAAISFGGFANDEKIQKHKEKLKNMLEEKGIKHSNDFSYLGYNPPYELFGRRNEVVVEISY